MVGNKVDAPGVEDAARRLEEEVRRDSVERAGGNEYAESPLNPKVFFTSAVTGKGVDALMKATGARVAELREAQRKALEGQEHFDQIWQHRRDAKDKKFKVTKLSEGVFRVTDVYKRQTLGWAARRRRVVGQGWFSRSRMVPQCRIYGNPRKSKKRLSGLFPPCKRSLYVRRRAR